MIKLCNQGEIAVKPSGHVGIQLRPQDARAESAWGAGGPWQCDTAPEESALLRGSDPMAHTETPSA